jgi:site-specific DNA-methyltransferase (adenine-specific)
MKPYYEEKGITIYHGDCREILPKLSPMDIVLTDPPYSEEIHKNLRQRRNLPDEAESLACANRCKDIGFDPIDSITMKFAAHEFSRLARRWVLVFSNIELTCQWRHCLTEAGLDYVRTGVWVKIDATPQFTGDRPAAGFESITIAHPKGKKRWNGGGSHAVWSYPILLNRKGGQELRVHPTQKPLALMARLVSLFSDPNETILDPFMGSGTVLLAAKNLGRKAIGIEIQEKHCEAAVKRLRQEVFSFT